MLWLGLAALHLAGGPELSAFGTHAQRDRTPSWTTTLTLLVSLVLIITCYSAVRFGVKDALTRFASSFSLIGTLGIAMWRLPTVSAIATVLGLLLFATKMFFADGRKAVGAIAILSFVQCFVWIGRPRAFRDDRSKYFFRALEPIMKVLLLAGYIIFIWLICAACTWVHRRILE
jgi:hypothetical protein